LTQIALSAPRDCTLSSSNWNLLSRFWHPVAVTSEIADRPYRFVLLDLNLVAYRTSAGLTVVLDRCPHRGSSLALGLLRNDRLVCGYHGLEFDGAGRCTAMPPAGANAKIPSRMCLTVFRSEVRYGLLWVSLSDNPIYPLPVWVPLEDPVLQKARMTPAEWSCSAARHAENFNDIAHFPWIHGATFADSDNLIAPRYRTENTAVGFRRSIKVNQLDREIFGFGRGTTTQMDYEYDFTFPFSSHLKISNPAGRVEHVFDAACPMSARRSRIFTIKARNFDLGRPVDEWVALQEAVNAEDKIMVESQDPQSLPLDRGAEIHIEADSWSIAYRRRWKELGME
jgi:phenylpropionate dioxygenase-like ring-hydroxylating dioxygenase large terminal subunit